MRKIKRLVAIATVTVMALSAVGCKMIEKTPEAIQKTVLAKVGNENITMGDVDNELKAQLDVFREKYGEDYESKLDEETKKQLEEARKGVLTQLVDEKVVLTKGAEFIPSEEELKPEIEKERETFTELYGGEEKLKEALEYYGMDDEKFNSFLETMVKMTKVRDAVTADITVSDEEVKEYYDKNIAKYTKKPGANAKHILFEKEEDAKAAKAKIDSGEATFEDIYKEYEVNNDGSGKKPVSQDLQYVENEQENFDKDFLAGFVKLKTENQVSDPVKSNFGYHLIKINGIVTEDKVTPLDEVKDEIKSNLEYAKKEEAYQDKVAEWTKELEVKTYEDRL